MTARHGTRPLPNVARENGERRAGIAPRGESHARILQAIVFTLFCITLADLSLLATAAHAEKLAVASKNFEENRLLAEMFARIIEDRTEHTVERNFDMAGTQLCFEALRTGAVDVYPEYTGTGLVSILGLPSATDPAQVLSTVRREFSRQWDLIWMAPLGFENSYEIGLRKDLVEEHSIRSISDLAPFAGEFRAALGAEFIGRPDGLPGLESTYGLKFGDVRSLQQNLKYEAAGQGEVDVIDVYTTDGHILKYGLVVLDDDRSFFPPYQAAALVRGETLRRLPEVGLALNELTDLINEDRMRSWNLRLQEEDVTVEVVAVDALNELGLITSADAPRSTSTKDRSVWSYMWEERGPLFQRVLEHLGMVGLSLLAAVALAVPLGLFLERQRGAAEWVIRAVGVLQTIPSIALLAFMIPALGVGAKPAVAALFLYALLPIVRNTFTGVRDADPEAVEAAWALGMTPAQVLQQVRLPLAMPFILAGVRTAAVINVGTATLAAFIGAGGLGEPIVTGLQLANNKIILSGAIPAALLALLVDGLLGVIEHWTQPKGLALDR